MSRCVCVADVRCVVCQARDQDVESVVVREVDDGWYWTASIGDRSWTGLTESVTMAWAHATARLGANR